MPTALQECQQVDGPGMPKPIAMAKMFFDIPKYLNIVAISINAQTATVIVEYRHEGLEGSLVFDVDKYNQMA